ncbi:MAG: class I SAM-dependent methyltransferase [Pseudomonadota bacterium]
MTRHERSIEDEGDLERAFSSSSSRAARAHYDDWAARYEAENLGKGMRHPFIAAAYFARHMPVGEAPILDAACGTGLVGEALKVLGYKQVFGCDLSEKMIRAARRYGAYEAFASGDLTGLPFQDGTFAGFTCVGAFGPGHAPPHALDELARVTRPGGIGVFTLREDTMHDQGFPQQVAELTRAGRWRAVEDSGAIRAYLIGEPELFARIIAVEVLR